MRNISLTVLILLVVSSAALADLTNQETTVQVQINPLFQIMVDQSVVNFGGMNPGETRSEIPATPLTLTCKTNNGNPWFLKISTASELTSGQYTIPDKNFSWYGWAGGEGSWYGSGSDDLSRTPALVYGSTLSEGNNLPDGNKIYLRFKLSVPATQNPGLYATTVRFTMTE